MEINESNFKILAQYLQQTLSPDPNVRRPGKRKNVGYVFPVAFNLIFNVHRFARNLNINI